MTMAKDDYHVIVYRILAYLYKCLKSGHRPSLDYLQYDTDDFPIGKSYWNYILIHLLEGGYIEGITLIPMLGDEEKVVRLTSNVRITPLGIEYLSENSTMNKAKEFLKGLKEIIPYI